MQSLVSAFNRQKSEMRPLLAGIALLGVVSSLLFSLFGYGGIAENLGNSLVTDRYDDLARGIVETGTLAYFPDVSPTVSRTPLYPLQLALCMELTGGRYTAMALALQALMHGGTSVLAALLAFRLRGRRAALVAGILCALHPALLWYSARLVIETQSTFLFTLIALAAVLYWQAPSVKRAMLTGAGIGLGLWCKAVFLPLLIALPVMIAVRGLQRRREGLVMLATALLIISPWLLRNYALTGRWPLFQALVGYNLYVSDSFVDHAAVSPFGYAGLIARLDYGGMDEGLSASDSLHSPAWLESQRDLLLSRRSIRRYCDDPIFLLKKAGLNAVWFWTLASSWKASLIMGLLQGALLIAVVSGVFPLVRRGTRTHAIMVVVWLSLAYMIPHLPVYALARFSVVIIPSLVAAAVAAHSCEAKPEGAQEVRPGGAV